MCLLAAPSFAGASSDGALSVKQAHRAYLKAKASADEAKRVWTETATYSRIYGAKVGRWLALSRRAGFTWGDVPHLMYVVRRESGGDPHAKNPASTASGLMQFLAFWWEGKWDPFDAYQNLRHGALAVHGSAGWQPWAL